MIGIYLFDIKGYGENILYQEIMGKLEKNGYVAYIIGGAVRDAILKETPKDIDIFTNATGEEILNIFPDGKIIGSEERQKKILTVIIDNIEVSTFRSNGNRTETVKTGKKYTHKILYTHISTCDFTINSIAMNSNGVIIDLYDGIKDLKKGIIRAVGDPEERINEDKVRVFRAIRFASRYNFEIEKELNEVILRTDISDIPVERIHDELYKIFKYESGAENLFKTNLLIKVIPEFNKLILMDGGHHHNETVDQHCLLTYKISCRHTDKVIHHIACLLHDIGKGPCMKVIDGKTKFLGHDMKGSYMIKKIMKQLNFSNKDIKYVSTLIRYHMWGISGIPRDKKFAEMFNELNNIDKNGVEDLVLLMYCDGQANMAETRNKFYDYITNDSKSKKVTGNYILKKYNELKSGIKPLTISDLKINGDDIISLGLPPSKKIGGILLELYNLTVDGFIKNERHEQMYWLRKKIKNDDKVIK